MTTPASASTRRRVASDTSNSSTEPEQLIKSRERVKAHGEVFTPRHMVDTMLDLVSYELETGPDFVDSTFFEPSAGDGNFLLAILQRKLDAIRQRLAPDTWPTESLFALASIYGIELLADNLQAAQSALLDEFVQFHTVNSVECNPSSELWRSAQFLIETNIQHGNTLTGLNPAGEEIEFSWWHRVVEVPGDVQREPFTFLSLRGQTSGMFNFAVFSTYPQCSIYRVHEARGSQ